MPGEVRTIQLYGVVDTHLTLLATAGWAFGKKWPSLKWPDESPAWGDGFLGCAHWAPF